MTDERFNELYNKYGKMVEGIIAMLYHPELLHNEAFLDEMAATTEGVFPGMREFIEENDKRFRSAHHGN